jgi:hypothetical protein
MSKKHATLVTRILTSGSSEPPTRNEMREFFSITEQSIKIVLSDILGLRAIIVGHRKLFREGIDAWFDNGILDFRYHDIKDFLDPLPSYNRTFSLALSSFENTSSKAPKAITDITFKTIEEARIKQGNHLETRLAELQEKCFVALDY